MIEKHINLALYVSGVIGQDSERCKIASFDPEVHVPEEISNFVDGLTPDPRFAYMHVIAMSDGDSYGSNMNGDIFTWDELLGQQDQGEAAKNSGDNQGMCLPRYKTFEQAKFFKHHANSPMDDSFGDVPLAVINLPMRRIELIIRIAREDVRDMGMRGAPDVCDKLDTGGVVPVSMGCRIGHEKCTYCGHENEFISQRCQHMSNQMGEIMPNGVRVAALNYKPRFFDISKVTIPADPIALSLGKVAAFMPRPAPNHSKDVIVKKSAWRQKWSEIVKELPADAAEKVCKEPGEPTLTAPSEFTTDELKKVASTGEFDEVISTASAMGIVFSPVEFAKLASCYGVESVEDVPFSGIDVMRVNFSTMHELKEKFAERSGYRIALHGGGWHPTKIAESGHPEMSDLYAFYRTATGCVPMGELSKAANAIPALRELIGRRQDVLAAGAYLSRAGL